MEQLLLGFNRRILLEKKVGVAGALEDCYNADQENDFCSFFW